METVNENMTSDTTVNESITKKVKTKLNVSTTRLIIEEARTVEIYKLKVEKEEHTKKDIDIYILDSSSETILDGNDEVNTMDQVCIELKDTINSSVKEIDNDSATVLPVVFLQGDPFLNSEDSKEVLVRCTNDFLGSTCADKALVNMFNRSFDPVHEVSVVLQDGDSLVETTDGSMVPEKIPYLAVNHLVPGTFATLLASKLPIFKDKKCKLGKHSASIGYFTRHPSEIGYSKTRYFLSANYSISTDEEDSESYIISLTFVLKHQVESVQEEVEEA